MREKDRKNRASRPIESHFARQVETRQAVAEEREEQEELEWSLDSRLGLLQFQWLVDKAVPPPALLAEVQARLRKALQCSHRKPST